MGNVESRGGIELIESTLLRLSDSSVEGSSDPALARTAAAADGAVARGGSLKLAGAARYEQMGLLGEGGMGRVDKVHDRDLLRDVAVKHLHPELLKDPRMLAQFLWEARITAYLDHPNIVPVHDLGLTAQGELFITMKLVRGTTLEAVIRQAHTASTADLNLTRRLRMFLPLCNAVSFAHSRSVVHRDLKPANVMIGEYGEILVTDWGLALPLPDSRGDALRAVMPSALTTRSAGTPLYMAPEQVRGEIPDARSDAYSLGVILYELVGLRPPFDAESVAELLQKVSGGASVPLREISPGVSPSLVAVVEKAMARDPAQRYENVAAIASDIEAVLDGHTPTAEQVSLGRRAVRYYVSRDPLMGKLRVVDIDLWAFSALLLGAGLMTLLQRRILPSAWVGLLLLLTSAFVAAIPTLRWLRLHRSRSKMHDR